MSFGAEAIRVCVVEDHAGLRQSLEGLLNGTAGYACAGCFANAEAALAGIPPLRPEVVLMDLHLPRRSGVECTQGLKARLPRTQVLMLTIEEDANQVYAALEAGASGYLLKRMSPGRLLEAIREVQQGGAPMSPQVARLVVQSFRERARHRQEQANLTPREREVLEWLTQGARTREIARQLGVSQETVHTHLGHIYEKLHVRSRAGAVAKYLGA